MNIMSKLFGYNDIGIDLGSANMRVWVKGKGLVMEEPAAVTLVVPHDVGEKVPEDGHHGEQDSEPHGKPRKHRILAIGAEAGAMLGKTPGSLIVIRPMKGGVVCDYDITKNMLRYCLAHEKVKEACKGRFRRPRTVIAVPFGITEVEKRALEDAAHSAGAGKVFLIESSMAAAIGAGLHVSEPMGCMIVDIGALATNMAVISLAGIVHSNVLRIGGDEVNNAIVAYLRKKYNLLVGEREAEDVKIKVGTACTPEKELDYEIRGIDATEGRKLVVKIDSKEIREEALAGLLGQIEETLMEFIAHIEPGLAADLVDNGIVLTGGGALLRGLDKRLAETTGLPVRVADNPAHATIEGVGVVLGELDFLAKAKRR
jgi:rod shape-determining protein MreB